MFGYYIYIYIYLHIWKTGTAVAQWLRCCATNRKVAGSIPASISGFFIDLKSCRSHYGPGVNSASNRNECQEYFIGGKGRRCIGPTIYHHPVPSSQNLGNLTSWKPLAPSRPVTGPFYLFTWKTPCSYKWLCPLPGSISAFMQSKYGHTGKSDWKPLGGLVKYKTLVEKPRSAIIYTHKYLVQNIQAFWLICSSDVWLTVHRNSVWIRKTN